MDEDEPIVTLGDVVPETSWSERDLEVPQVLHHVSDFGQRPVSADFTGLIRVCQKVE